MPGLQAEDLFVGISQPRNERLANVFYRLKHIEAYGTGLRLIMQYYEDFEVKPAEPVLVPPAHSVIPAERIPVQPMRPSPTPHTGNMLEEATAALPKKLNTKLSAGIKAIIQVNISGDKAFRGYICLHSNECTYEKGEAPAPDMTIMTDSKTWQDVLEGKNTAQKSFMIGGLKVRGDFVLLSKFDTLFA